ncbi:MAG: hypothetical protein AVDCRST_MAG53-1637, partial [uncultured Solirubrobacteraceae bacterium]
GRPGPPRPLEPNSALPLRAPESGGASHLTCSDTRTLSRWHATASSPSTSFNASSVTPPQNHLRRPPGHRHERDRRHRL